MAVLNVTIPDFLQFPTGLRSAIPSLSLPSNDFILYPVGLKNLCPWPFHYSSYTRSEILRVRFVCLSFSILLPSPHPAFVQCSFYILQPTLSPFGSSFHRWTTSQYCNVRHNALLSKRCAERRKRLKKGAIRFAREEEKHAARTNEYTRVS